MSDDWKPGDWALCVNDRGVWCGCGYFHDNTLSHLRKGRTAVVATVSPARKIARKAANGCSCTALVLANGDAGLAVRFRKIRPHTPDAEDVETIRLLTGKPVREPAA